MELLKIIVLLCQINPMGYGSGMGFTGYTHQQIAKDQLKCQQYYIRCTARKAPKQATDQVLKRCINRRQI